jgi:ketosteroid isomerase-like protein
MNPRLVVERAQKAINSHDLEGFVACFDEDYQSEQPAYPSRTFRGREQVRKNWSGIFSSVPDVQAEIVRSSVEGDTVWTEWRWYGTQTDGTPFDVRSVTIFGVQSDQIIWGRLYMEPVQQSSNRTGG